MGFLDKVKAEAKRVENRAKKEISRVETRVKKKVDAEVDRSIVKYSPIEAVIGIGNMNTVKLMHKLKPVFIETLEKTSDVVFDWAEEEIRISKSKLDNLFLPLLPSIEEQVRKVIDRMKT